MLTELNIENKEAVKINLEKTKVITNQPEHSPIKIDTIAERVKEYKYLGQIISMRDCQTKEVNERISKAWKSYWALKVILQSNVSIEKKAKIINTCIKPVLTYT